MPAKEIKNLPLNTHTISPFNSDQPAVLTTSSLLTLFNPNNNPESKQEYSVIYAINKFTLYITIKLIQPACPSEE